jgi:hypothetical protein
MIRHFQHLCSILEIVHNTGGFYLVMNAYKRQSHLFIGKTAAVKREL